MVSKYLEVLRKLKDILMMFFFCQELVDDVVSTHLGSTLKTSWGDGQRQADVGDTEDQRGTGGK